MKKMKEMTGKQRAMRIMKLCLEINAQGKHIAFLDFSGHVDLVSVRIHLNGWVKDEDPSFSFDLSITSTYKTQKEMLKEWETAEDYLLSIKN